MAPQSNGASAGGWPVRGPNKARSSAERGDITAPRLATQDLDALTDELQIVADWRDDLFARMDRYELVGELIGLSENRLAEIEHEVNAFTRVCRLLADSLPGRLAEAA